MSITERLSFDTVSRYSDVSDFEEPSRLGPYLEGHLKLLDTM